MPILMYLSINTNGCRLYLIILSRIGAGTLQEIQSVLITGSHFPFQTKVHEVQDLLCLSSYYLDSTVYIFQNLFYHISIHQSILFKKKTKFVCFDIYFKLGCSHTYLLIQIQCFVMVSLYPPPLNYI